MEDFRYWAVRKDRILSKSFVGRWNGCKITSSLLDLLSSFFFPSTSMYGRPSFFLQSTRTPSTSNPTCLTFLTYLVP